MVELAAPNEELWSMKAKKQFNLRLMSDQEHSASRQTKWQAYVEDRTKAEAAERRMAAKAAAHPNGDWAFQMHNYVECTASITRAIPTGINNMLASAANLEHQDFGILRACVVVLHAAFVFDGVEVRSAEFATRLYSPASTAAVDLRLTYRRRTLWDSIDYRVVLLYALADAATDPYAQGHKKDECHVLYTLSNNNDDPRLAPPDMKWMYYPDPKLRLTLRQLQLLRRHLFGDAAAALSDWLSDVELVQLLIVSAGGQWNEFVPQDEDEGEESDEYSDDEWERLSPFGLPLNGLGSDENEGRLERRVRELCNEPRPEDAKAKDYSIEKELQEHVMFWAMKNRSDRVCQRIRKRIEQGRFTKEAFSRDRPPKGYHDASGGCTWSAYDSM